MCRWLAVNPQKIIKSFEFLLTKGLEHILIAKKAIWMSTYNSNCQIYINQQGQSLYTFWMNWVI